MQILFYRNSSDNKKFKSQHHCCFFNSYKPQPKKPLENISSRDVTGTNDVVIKKIQE